MDYINLLGLSYKNLLLYNNIMRTFQNYLLKIDVTTQVNCNIIFKKINILDSHNCNLRIENKCSSNKEISFNLFLKAIKENEKIMSVEQKQKLEKGLGVKISDINISSNEGFIKKCKIYASIANEINVKELTVTHCVSSFPLDFIFFNTGSADANCGIVEFINSLGETEAKSSEEDYVKILTKILNLTLKDYIYIICILLSITILIFIFYYCGNILFFFQRIKLKLK